MHSASEAIKKRGWGEGVFFCKHLELVHAGRAGAARGLVGGHDDALEAVLLEERVERHDPNRWPEKERGSERRAKRVMRARVVAGSKRRALLPVVQLGFAMSRLVLAK